MDGLAEVGGHQQENKGKDKGGPGYETGLYCHGGVRSSLLYLILFYSGPEDSFSSGPSYDPYKNDTDKYANAVNAHIFHGRGSPGYKRLVVFIPAGKGNTNASR